MCVWSSLGVVCVAVSCGVGQEPSVCVELIRWCMCCSILLQYPSCGVGQEPSVCVCVELSMCCCGVGQEPSVCVCVWSSVCVAVV